jgi:pimeloyl-ACP methyl ester carboxylesterase
VAVAPLRSQGTVAADVAGVSWRRAFEKGGLERGSWLSGHDRGGPGESVVPLHGLAGHAGEWEVVASRLIARYQVVAVDQRGHGASERHPYARTSTS